METINIVYYENDIKTTITKTLSGTEDSIFEEFYKLNNQLRYCNGSHWSFENKTIYDKYLKWKKFLLHNRSFNLYYGKNGIVD